MWSFIKIFSTIAESGGKKFDQHTVTLSVHDPTGREL